MSKKFELEEKIYELACRLDKIQNMKTEDMREIEFRRSELNRLRSLDIERRISEIEYELTKLDINIKAHNQIILDINTELSYYRNEWYELEGDDDNYDKSELHEYVEEEDEDE